MPQYPAFLFFPSSQQIRVYQNQDQGLSRFLKPGCLDAKIDSRHTKVHVNSQFSSWLKLLCCFKFQKSVTKITGLFNVRSLQVLTQQPWGPSGFDWRPKTDVPARSCVFTGARLVSPPAQSTCACAGHVCTAVYLTQMFLLGLKCLFVSSSVPDPLHSSSTLKRVKPS